MMTDPPTSLNQKPNPTAGNSVATNGAAAGALPRRGLLGRARASSVEFVGFCRQHPRWLACMIVFVGVWTAELWTVQEITLVYPNEVSAKFALFAPKIRLLLDVLFIATLSFWLRRRWLCLIVVGVFFAHLGLSTYFKYFPRPLTLVTITGHWHEGVQLTGSAWDMIPRRAALLLLAALVVKLAALFGSRRVTLPSNLAWLGGALTAAAYVMLYAFTLLYDPLSAIQTTRGVGRLGEIRGYLGPWFAEWYYLHDGEILERAIEYRKLRFDRLTPHEADIPVHDKLVILQAESLDYNILGYKVNGQEVTPFLNRLRDMSMFYRVTAMHFNGSSDADFVALNGVSGSRHENTYVIPGYPYENTTPQLLARCGFKTYSFHGNSGEFYSRRAAFEQMGFTELNFQEELEQKHGLPGSHWGVTDKEVLAYSAQRLRNAAEPTCHFIVTLTTHTPYTFLAPGDKEIFPNPRNTVENFINNMRYLDNCLRDYITALGSGVTVMIYADHPTEEGDATFRPDRDGHGGGREYIPCFIYDTDQDLSKLQKTSHNPITQDGTLNLVDMINYLRGQVERSRGQSTAAPAGAALPAEPAQAEITN